MLRDPSLVPLSHQHQHALALCVRLERAPRADAEELLGWNAEIDRLFLVEIRFHFDAEERLLFPDAVMFPEMAALVQELTREHASLRDFFMRAVRGELDSDALLDFARLLSGHVRKEERQLFEDCQRLMAPAQIARIGAAMNELFSTMPGVSCSLERQP